MQLHVFCDASENAFVAIANLRYQHQDNVHVILEMAKTRVAPLKPMSILRLELQAAVMGSCLAATLKKEFDIKIASTQFWMESQMVLHWIRSNETRYKMFVANHIGEIEELVGVTDWHWVPTMDNVADDATLDTSDVDISPDSHWWMGPPFLQSPVECWPK